MNLASDGPNRPMRALVAVLATYGAGRAAVLNWPEARPAEQPLPTMIGALTPTADANSWAVLPIEPGVDRFVAPVRLGWNTPTQAHRKIAETVESVAPHKDTIGPGQPTTPLFRVSADASKLPQQNAAPPMVNPVGSITSGSPATRDTSHRLTGSAWTLLRGGTGAALGDGTILGGAQAGVRLYQPIGHGLSLTSRLSAPLGQALGREATLGLAFRRRFIGVIVEHRFALDRGASNDLAITGFVTLPVQKLPGGLRFDCYAQAGMVGIRRHAAFADGALSLTRAIAPQLDLGAGIWAATQPGANRIDAGPLIAFHPRIGPVSIRASAEYRLRIAGNAEPGSGPALTIGLDF